MPITVCHLEVENKNTTNRLQFFMLVPLTTLIVKVSFLPMPYNISWILTQHILLFKQTKFLFEGEQDFGLKKEFMWKWIINATGFFLYSTCFTWTTNLIKLLIPDLYHNI